MLTKLLWIIAGFAFGGIAAAQPVTGLYLGAGGGANFADPYGKTVSTNQGFSETGEVGSSIGPVALGSIGFGFGPGLRAELEGSYRRNPITKTSLPTLPGGVRGELRQYAAMTNLLHDFDVGSADVVPYAGVGFGATWTEYDTIGQAARFAAQAIAGLSFPIPGVPGLSLTAEYRFFGALGTTVHHTAYNAVVYVPVPAQIPFNFSGQNVPTYVPYYNFVPKTVVVGEKVERGDDLNNSALIGLRYAFNAPPPPVPAPAEPPPAAAGAARNYLIFFDWDRATLTARARQIVGQAAGNAAHGSLTAIEVDGYTDTSGTPRYNEGLSVRRAEAVAAELVRDGVARADIAIHGFGETKLLVQTAAGVREPQNRRVEIILR